MTATHEVAPFRYVSNAWTAETIAARCGCCVSIPVRFWRERAVHGPSRSIEAALRNAGMIEGWYSVAVVILMECFPASLLRISASKSKEEFG